MIQIERTKHNRKGVPVTKTETFTDTNQALQTADLYAAAGWLVAVSYI